MTERTRRSEKRPTRSGKTQGGKRPTGLADTRTGHRDREGIPLHVIRDRGGVVLGVCDARHLVERRLVRERGRREGLRWSAFY